MKRKIMLLLIVMMCISTALFATRIRVTYNDAEYILVTSRTISDDNVAYFNGMYDAFSSIMRGDQLYEIYNTVNNKSFVDVEGVDDPALLKQEYEEAFLDCMNNYSYGAEGEFKDIWPIYKALMSRPISYQNAQDIVYYGSARFYVTNI